VHHYSSSRVSLAPSETKVFASQLEENVSKSRPFRIRSGGVRMAACAEGMIGAQPRGAGSRKLLL
jgi:hypothetical protein